MYLSFALYLLLFQSCESHITLKEVQSSEHLERCLLNAVLASTEPRDTIAIIKWGSSPHLWTKVLTASDGLLGYRSFIQSKHLSAQKLAAMSKVNFKENVDMFLIDIDDHQEFKFIMETLKNYRIFNARVNFLVTSMTRFQNQSWIVSSIFEVLWKTNAYNTLVVLPDRSDNSKIDLYTWYPYGKHHCAKDFTTYTKINACNNGQLQTSRALYPNKIPAKLRNCPITARTVVWPPFVMKPTKRIANTDKYIFKQGFEIILMNTIAHSMNLNLTYTLSEKNMNWGVLYDNGTATGMQAVLLQNEGDIGLSSQAYTVNRLKFFDMGSPYFFEHLVWCVPHALAIPPTQKIVDVFSIGTWTLNIFSFSMFILLVWSLSRLNSERRYYNSFANCVQNAFGILLGVAIFPSPRSNSVKLIFSFWFAFTMHLNIIYKTNLICMLTDPIYDDQIKTLDEILKSDLRLQFMPGMKKYFGDNQTFSKEILEKWVDCIDLGDCMDRVAYTRDSVILLPKLYLQFVEQKYRRKHSSYVSCFNGNIVTYPGSMVMRKGFPLRDRMNSIIWRMVSAGLVEQWQKDALRISLVLKNKTTLTEQTDEELKVVRFKEQQPAFVCLGVGLGFATMAFVCEIIMARFNRRYIFTL